MSADGYALAALAFYAAVAIVVTTIQARHSAATWQVWILHVIARTYSSLLFQIRIRQLCPLPSEGGAFLIVNHRSPVDPLLVFAASPRRRDGYRIRPLEFLTASEYTRIGGFIGFVCKHMQSIPVDRDGRDMEPAKEALRRLQNGHIVGIFPEGRINTGDGLLPGNPGVAWLAIKAGMPVIPTFIHGAPQPGGMVKPFYTPARCRVVFGEPFDLSEFAGQRLTPDLLGHVTEFLMQRLAETGGLARKPLSVVTGDDSADTRESA